MTPPIQVLQTHFFQRFFDRDSASRSGNAGDAQERLIQVLAMLATPGLMIAFTLAIGGFGSRNISFRERYVFVCYSMVVTGLIMTLKWDMLFPDRRDFVNLGTLPISVRELFVAKLRALAAFLGLFVVAANFFPALIIPGLYAEGAGTWRVWPRALFAHLAATTGGALFMILAFGAIQGILVSLLPPQTFRRWTPRVQVMATGLLVASFMTLPLATGSIGLALPLGNSVLGSFPVVWFLGLYELLLPGGRESAPAFLTWAKTASLGTATALFVAAGAYAAAYRGYVRRLLETESGEVHEPGTMARRVSDLRHRILLGSPYERACFDFIGKISVRSQPHRIFVALCLGAGTGLSLSSLFAIDRTASPPFVLRMQGVLEAPLILSFLLVAGLRASFSMPYALSANYVFQIAGHRGEDFLRATRKWVFVARVIPLCMTVAVLEFFYFRFSIAAAHLIFDACLAGLLTMAFFSRFGKIPYTCAHTRNRLQLGLLAVGYLWAFTSYVSYGGQLKAWATATPGHLLTFCLGSVVLMAALGQVTRSRRWSVRIAFEDVEPAYQQLNLSG